MIPNEILQYLLICSQPVSEELLPDLGMKNVDTTSSQHVE